MEVINDLNGELINFYRVLKLNFEALKREIETSIHAREWKASSDSVLNPNSGENAYDVFKFTYMGDDMKFVEIKEYFIN